MFLIFSQTILILIFKFIQIITTILIQSVLLTMEKFTGWPGNLSPEQTEALNNFKANLPKEQLQQFNDAHLLRFLRARKFKLKDVQKMWDEFIQWRIKNNVDTIESIKLPEIPDVRKFYPHGYHKVDKQFRPIYIERVGKLNIDQMWKSTTEERMLQYYTLSYQYLLKHIFPACTEAKRKALGPDAPPVDQTITILDMKDVSLSSASKTYGFVKPVMKMAQDNYPEMLGNMFIINAPFLFSGVWMVLKPFLDDKTTSKIKIIGSSYKKELLQYIDAQNLPDFLDGGKSKGEDLVNNVGPWNPQGKEIFENQISK